MQFRRQSTFRSIVALSSLMLYAFAAIASPRSDAWKLRRSNPEAAISQLQQVVQQDPSDAKAFWYLAMLYNNRGRGAEGLQALNSARQADPSLSFASSPTAVSSLEAALQRRAGTSSATTRDAGSSSTNGSADNSFTMSQTQQQDIQRALGDTGVWVAPSLQGAADANAIAQEVRKAPHPVKVLVLDALPSQGGRPVNLNAFAKRLHSWLKLDKGMVIVISHNTRKMAAHGGFFLLDDQKATDKILLSAAPVINTKGYAPGVGQIVREFYAEEDSRNRAGNIGLLLIIGLPTGGVIWLVRRNKKKKAEELVELREETRELSSQLAPQYEKLDSDYEFAIVAEQDAGRKKQLMEARSRAGEAFSAGMKQVNYAEDYNSMAAARGGLMQAREQMQRARNILDGKPEDEGLYQAPPPRFGTQQAAGAFGQGRGNWNNDDEIPPIVGNYPGARPGYALDFFTSEPVPVDQLVPVDIDMDGQRKRVWATRESAQRFFSGQGGIATVNAGGQQVPWYAAPNQYNPYQDFGSTMLQMVAINMMMNAMFMPHYSVIHHHHGGWGGDSGGGYGGSGDSGSAWGNDWNSNDSGSGGDSSGGVSFDSPFGGDWTNSGGGDSGGVSFDMFGDSGGGDFGGFDGGGFGGES